MVGPGFACSRTSKTTPLPACLIAGLAVKEGAWPAGAFDTGTEDSDNVQVLLESFQRVVRDKVRE